jgi:acetolactate synthase-1/2/3 large subunit
MFNLQELQTLITNKVVANVFVFNNAGYRSIRMTQDEFLEGRHLGSSTTGRIEISDISRIATAFGIPFKSFNTLSDFAKFDLASEGIQIIELVIDPDQEIYPRVGFSPKPGGGFMPAPLDQMYPNLERKP